MTEFIKRLSVFALLLFIASSCTSRGYFQLTDKTRLTENLNADKVAVYVTDDAGSPYTILGAVIVSSDAGNDATATVRMLKTEAAKLEADAIVNMKMRYSYGVWGMALEVRGLAVKLNP